MMATESKLNPKNLEPKKLRRPVKWIIYFGVLCGILWGMYRYDLERIPADHPFLVGQNMAPTTRVITADYNEDTVVGVGTVLFFEADDGRESLGVVVAVGGEQIAVSDEDPGSIRIDIGIRSEVIEVPEKHQVRAGIVPEDHYFILRGDRSASDFRIYPDSRILGPIAKSRLRRKVVTPLYIAP